MLVRRYPMQRILAATIAVVCLGGASALADPLVGATTSKVITTIAHILIERVAGSTVDRIIAPYIDQTLVTYLSGNPGKVEPVLQQQQAQLSNQVKSGNVAESDLPILKQQLELVQKELAALKAIQAASAQAAPTSDSMHKADVHIADGIVQMEQKIDSRGQQLASVQEKLTDVSARVEQHAAAVPTPAPDATALRKPSFDCKRAKTEMEHLICDDPNLSDIDGRLGDVYWELRRLLAPSESQELKRQEIAWIKNRVDVLKAKCMPGGKTDMPCVIGLWKERIAQLEAQLQNAKNRKL